jgi:hypothetical protein
MFGQVFVTVMQTSSPYTFGALPAFSESLSISPYSVVVEPPFQPIQNRFLLKDTAHITLVPNMYAAGPKLIAKDPNPDTGDPISSSQGGYSWANERLTRAVSWEVAKDSTAGVFIKGRFGSIPIQHLDGDTKVFNIRYACLCNLQDIGVVDSSVVYAVACIYGDSNPNTPVHTKVYVCVFTATQHPSDPNQLSFTFLRKVQVPSGETGILTGFLGDGVHFARNSTENGSSPDTLKNVVYEYTLGIDYASITQQAIYTGPDYFSQILGTPPESDRVVTDTLNAIVAEPKGYSCLKVLITQLQAPFIRVFHTFDLCKLSSGGFLELTHLGIIQGYSRDSSGANPELHLSVPYHSAYAEVWAVQARLLSSDTIIFSGLTVFPNAVDIDGANRFKYRGANGASDGGNYPLAKLNGAKNDKVLLLSFTESDLSGTGTAALLIDLVARTTTELAQVDSYGGQRYPIGLTST